MVPTSRFADSKRVSLLAVAKLPAFRVDLRCLMRRSFQTTEDDAVERVADFQSWVERTRGAIARLR